MSGFKPGYIGWELCTAKYLGNGMGKYFIYTTITNNPESLLLPILLPAALAILTPLDNILVKLQTQGLANGIKIQGLPEAYRIASNSGLFRGVEIQYAKGFVYSSTFAMLLKYQKDDGKYKFLNFYLSAIVASLVALPLDFIRVNMQKYGSTSDIVKIATETYNAHGINGFYKGTVAAISRPLVSLIIVSFLKSKVLS